MTDYEFVSQTIDYINAFGSPRTALKAVRETPVPNKDRAVKKRLMKFIRTYIYITEHKEATAVES